jgi:hypothetical protein
VRLFVPNWGSVCRKVAEHSEATEEVRRDANVGHIVAVGTFPGTRIVATIGAPTRSEEHAMTLAEEFAGIAH